MAEATLRLPPVLDLLDENLAETFKKWKRQVEVYMLASGASSKSKKTRAAIILHCAGPQALEVCDQFQYDDPENREDPDIILEKLSQYCCPQTSEVLQSFRFWQIPFKEPFHSFLVELRTQAEYCNFAERDRMLRDKIVFSTTGKLQELLLRETTLDLNRTIDICQAFEATKKCAKEMCSVQDVNKVNFSQKDQKTASLSGENTGDGATINKCKFCGYNHEPSRFQCPAWGKTCNNCKGRNHFRSVCTRKRTVRAIERDTDEQEIFKEKCSEYAWMNVVSGKEKSRETALLNVNKTTVRFFLDTGADINAICQRFVKKYQVKPTPVNLKMWNKSILTPFGETELEVSNPKNGKSTQVKFIVVPNDLMCILGKKTCQDLGFVTINSDTFISKVDQVPKIQDLGDLGQAKLTVVKDVPPRALPCRRLPQAIQVRVRQELDLLVKRGVLIPIHEPTEWVSQMAIVQKANGKLRICIDPQPLNRALLREYYKLPTLDDVLPSLAHAKLFSKLDVKEAFWHVRLDEDSSKLTTMITPFGRYRWNRLPFGLKVSSEIFQRLLTEALEGLHGVFCVADDIVVVGCGKTENEARRDHDQKLQQLQQRCSKKNIKLNEEKEIIRTIEITFMGHRLTSSGVKVDETKVKAILGMPAPDDVAGVRRFCGMIQYLAKFMPNLSSDLSPIRELTKKGVKWEWSSKCEEAFMKLKKKITETPVLAYFDPDKELSLQVDSSKDGLGAVLMQEGRPLEYASRTLSSNEKNWAQIEKEALAVLYGLERFDQYTYGRKVIVYNDHKPLASILKKPLSEAPVRLQVMMMKLNRYDVEFNFLAGTNLYLADTLSRACCIEENDSLGIHLVNALEKFPSSCLHDVEMATLTDETMQDLLRVIRNGWPVRKTEVKETLKPYFDFRDTLSHQEGIILKGSRLLIPETLRSTMRNRLHAAHLGYDSMMRRARDAIFWPGMQRDIKQLSEACDVCQKYKPCNPKETMHTVEDGSKPWNKIAVDLFEIGGRHYVVAVDYYSSFIEMEYLISTTSSHIVGILKKMCARYGIPAVLVSDGGPQFTSSQFKSFVKEWGINHRVSSPGHPQGNGKAEAAVKIVKTMLKKTSEDGKDPYLAMLELRNTPRQDSDASPAQLMFGRQLDSLIPSFSQWNGELHEKKIQEQKKRREAIEKCYNKNARDMITLNPQQHVYYQNPGRREWEEGVVESQEDDRSYIINGKNGGVYRRNRLHIRPRPVSENENAIEDEKKEQPESSSAVSELKLPRRSARLAEKANI